ncbi:YbhB/YbcL family Raf kinase inhibitor-like protein [Dyella choica]|uniref:YbhB/YbcL family Raf kinase inhibitor-like protein n=1 Tax=Dyella choica TaxID=1927959 RepID=A0A3S0RLN2_9GAMM|nr:YbhB/YbcL family Raf kinase inhibitor-like protein [Dyella choica]RUL77540.1 YbhB/YbcL family Raf kinase inhibitor-like protein [Dyella choica]
MIGRILGRLLRDRHAGERWLLWNELPTAAHGDGSMELKCAAFAHGTTIPRRYAGDGVGDNVSPPLHWTGVPDGTAELVLVMEDPDAPLRRPFVHLIAAGIAPDGPQMAEGALDGQRSDTRIILGLTTFGKPGYSGPRALAGHGPHRYVFQLFALKQPSGLAWGARRKGLPGALSGKVIARARLDGYFERI